MRMLGRRVFGALQREVTNLHEAAYILALFTFASQCTALIRDRVFAHAFGVGETLDIFYSAFRIPDTLYALLASMLSLFVLIPFFEVASQRGASAVRSLMSELFSFFSFALIAVSSIVWILVPNIVQMLYGSLYFSAGEEIVTMTRILLLQPILLGVSNLFSAYVQTRGRFILYALAPILYNAGIIFGVFVFYPVLGMAGLGWGVVLGAVLHLAVQTPFILREGVFPHVVMPNVSRIRDVIFVSVPRTLALSAQQIVLLVLVGLATTIGVGAVSAFTFAWNVASVPIALIGASFSVAAFPTLSRLYQAGDKEGYARVVVFAVRQMLFWAVPLSVFFIVLRAQIVRVLLGTGAFDWDATTMTAAVLAILTVSLVAQALVILMVRALYATGRTVAPLAFGIISASFTAGVATLLLHFVRVDMFDIEAFAYVMRVPEASGVPLLMLPLALTLGALLHAGMLVVYMVKRVGISFATLTKMSVQVVVASFVGGVATYGTLVVFGSVLTLTTTVEVFLHGAIGGCVGVGAWAGMLHLLKNEDFAELYQTVRYRLFRTRVRDVRGPL